MNRKTTNHRRATNTTNPPTILAKLDLADKGQRRLHDLIRRTHTGRWPMLRSLGMRQIGGVLYEAVEWLRMATPSYGVMRWKPDGLGMSWQTVETEEQARLMLKNDNALDWSAEIASNPSVGLVALKK